MRYLDEYLIVDGYNIINSWPELVELKNRSFEHAREKLVAILSDFQGLIGTRTTVVFDAGNVKGGLESREIVGGITVIYTQYGETADEVIEKLVAGFPAGYTIFVATSDFAEQRMIFGLGAYRLSARELYERVQRAKQDREKFASAGSLEKHGLFSTLDEDTKDTLERLRRSK